MSLTGQLNDPHSPVSRLLGELLPGTAQVTAAYRARLGTAEPVRPAWPDGRKPPHSQLGTAVDLRLRAAFTDRLVPTPQRPQLPPYVVGMVALGALGRQTGGPAAVSCARAAVLGAELLDALHRLLHEQRPHDRNRPLLLPPTAEERLDRICYALAWYDVVYRTGRVVPGSVLGRCTEQTGLDDLLGQVPAPAVRDLTALAQVAAGSELADLRARTTPDQVTPAPTFAGSRAVGGADGDLVAGGLLLDVKASMHPRRLGPKEVRQVAGYLLLDHDDTHRLDTVGFYLARTGDLVTWPVEHFLELLGATADLPTLRARTREAIGG